MKKVLVESVRTKLVIKESYEKEPGVLAVVEGTFAEYGKRNKNNRLYEKAVWDRTLLREDIQAAIKGKRMFGELDHPEDYVDIKLDKTALCVTKLEMDEATQTIQGQFKVLDTPAGKLLNTLIRFGSVLGVSSRASGDLDEDGRVIPETYDFVTFDVVSNPSNAGALPSLVESVQGDDNVNTIKAALLEAVKEADSKTLVLIESIAHSLNEESAAEIINKVEERKSTLKESEVSNEVIMDHITSIEAKLDNLINMFMSRFGDNSAETEDSPKDSSAREDGDGEIVETVIKPRARKRVIISESSIEETPIKATINEGVANEPDRKQVELIKANKTR